MKAVRTVFAHTSGTVEAAVEYAGRRIYGGLEQNLFHFSAAKTLAEVQSLNQAFRESKSYNEFKARAAEITHVQRPMAAHGVPHAVQVAEAASNYQLRRRADIFPYWVYRTAGDGQVRPSHAALDGLTLPASDPEWSKIYPPNDWGCRCWVDAIMAEEFDGDITEERQKVQTFMTSAEWKRATAQGWGVNRAETAEVFTANQMYIRKFPDRAASLIGKLYCQHYNLPSFGKRLAAATESFRPFTGDATEWY
ncbi:MAG: phage minor head protein, partial [Alistipes onderdonkii]